MSKPSIDIVASPHLPIPMNSTCIFMKQIHFVYVFCKQSNNQKQNMALRTEIVNVHLIMYRLYINTVQLYIYRHQKCSAAVLLFIKFCQRNNFILCPNWNVHKAHLQRLSITQMICARPGVIELRLETVVSQFPMATSTPLLPPRRIRATENNVPSVLMASHPSTQGVPASIKTTLNTKK